MVCRYETAGIDWGGERVVFGREKPASEPEFVDTVLKCTECGNEFLCEAGEQRFYFRHSKPRPRLCKQCRANRKGKSQ
jgi:putative zinc ribbon protein